MKRKGNEVESMFKGMVRNGLACNLSSDGVASKMEMIKISGMEKEPRSDQILLSFIIFSNFLKDLNTA